MILRCADRSYRAWTDESKETLRRSCQLSPQQRRESRHSGTAAFGRLCCKSPKTLCGKISAKRQNKRQSSIGVASNAPPKSSVSSSQNEVVPHINIRLPHPRPGKSVLGETKRVL